jgi:hypothetical protein
MRYRVAALARGADRAHGRANPNILNNTSQLGKDRTCLFDL